MRLLLSFGPSGGEMLPQGEADASDIPSFILHSCPCFDSPSQRFSGSPCSSPVRLNRFSKCSLLCQHSRCSYLLLDRRYRRLSSYDILLPLDAQSHAASNPNPTC